MPRIREADAFIDDCADSESILETHPEACFVALHDDQPLENSKKTDPGVEERLTLLEETVDFDVEQFHDEAIETFRQPSYAPMIGAEDDILDALVAAVTAASSVEIHRSLPRDKCNKPDRDEELGRDIEIIIPTGSPQV